MAILKFAKTYAVCNTSKFLCRIASPRERIQHTECRRLRSTAEAMWSLTSRARLCRPQANSLNAFASRFSHLPVRSEAGSQSWTCTHVDLQNIIIAPLELLAKKFLGGHLYITKSGGRLAHRSGWTSSMSSSDDTVDSPPSSPSRTIKTTAFLPSCQSHDPAPSTFISTPLRII
jgi:hypothetical protein